MSPLERYQISLTQEGFTADKAQQTAIEKLQALYETLKKAESTTRSQSVLGKWREKWAWKRRKTQVPIKGLYFWGGVGRGKTYLMDIFFDSLPFERKMRVHFHRFMKRVHAELKTLNHQKNPLDIVADRIANEARVICFDEFFVSDITDAMILGGLFEALFHRGVTLVATSNIIPDGLYKDGLQRARFLPAIALINQHTEIVNVDGGTDYRLRNLQQADLFYSPLNATSEQSLEHCFNRLLPDIDEVRINYPLEIEGRELLTKRYCEDVVWFEFSTLCDGPRSQNDYIELAKEFHAVVVSNVPVFNESKEDQARRFINLIDEFYDRNVKLILSAESGIADLYQGVRLTFEFERTVSRLLEMQSETYLAAAHKP